MDLDAAFKQQMEELEGLSDAEVRLAQQEWNPEWKNVHPTYARHKAATYILEERGRKRREDSQQESRDQFSKSFTLGHRALWWTVIGVIAAIIAAVASIVSLLRSFR